MAVIIGDHDNGVHNGTGDPDTVFGLGGADTIFGNAGNDILHGEAPLSAVAEPWVYYKFDGQLDFQDGLNSGESGSDYNLSFTGSNNSSPTGIIGQFVGMNEFAAANLGVGEVFETNWPVDAIAGNGSGAFSVWMQVPGIAGGGNQGFEPFLTVGLMQIGFQQIGGVWYLRVQGNDEVAGVVNFSAPLPVAPVGTGYHHIGVSFTQTGVVSLYYDGNLAGQSAPGTMDLNDRGGSNFVQFSTYSPYTSIQFDDFGYWRGNPLDDAAFAAIHFSGTHGLGLGQTDDGSGFDPDVLSNPGSDSIYGGDGADTIFGYAGDDRLFGGDTPGVYGGQSDTLYGGNGNDFLSGLNNSDRLYGGAGADTALGGQGLDRVFGGKGNDTLYGGAAGDTLNGGDGNDTVIGDEGDDTIQTSPGADVIDGGANNAGGDWYVYTMDPMLSTGPGPATINLATGTVVSADALMDGDSLSGIENVDLSTNFNHIVHGNASANTIVTARGNDTLSGGNGGSLAAPVFDYLLPNAGTIDSNVFLFGNGDPANGGSGFSAYFTMAGGAGNDTALGSNGNDTLLIGSLAAGDVETFSFGGGSDTLAGYTGNDVFDDDLYTFIGLEVMRGGLGNDHLELDSYSTSVTMFGDDGADVIISGTAADTLYGGDGDDTLTALDGNDTLSGGLGADTMYGGAGANDWLRYDFDGGASGISINLGTGGTDSGGSIDVLNGNIENIAGTGRADTIIGTNVANTIVGNSGNDVLAGQGGADVIYGDDTLGAASGNDTIDGGGGADTVFGGDGNDVVNGVFGIDLLYGGAGDDTINGGGDADVLDGGAGANDWADYGSSGAVSVNLGTGTGSGNDAQGDTLTQIEHLAGSILDDTLVGDSNANSLVGRLGNDVLRGRGGGDFLFGEFSADTLFGDAGTDRLYGGDGNDVLTGGASDDIIDGGNGFDTLDYLAEGGPGGVTVNLATSTATDSFGNTDTITGVDHVNGTNFADNITAVDAAFGLNGQDNTLFGHGGNDTLHGGGLQDAIFGGIGDDTVTGGGGIDTIDGGDGADWVDYSVEVAGANGVSVNLALGSAITFGVSPDADVLVDLEHIRGTGLADVLIGAEDANSIFGNNGNDTIYGAGGVDIIDGQGDADLIYGGNDNDTLTGNEAADTIFGGAGLDWIYGGVDTDILYGGFAGDRIFGGDAGDIVGGDGGSDSLYGGAGGDVIFGGDGIDRIYGGTGRDVLYGGDGNDVIIDSDLAQIADGGAGDDYLSISYTDNSQPIAYLQGGTGNDIVIARHVANNGSVAVHGDDGGNDGADHGADELYIGGSYETLTSALGGGDDLFIGAGSNFDDLAGGATGARRDVVQGGAGNDEIAGWTGDDVLYGDDIANTMSGSDKLWGGAGADTVFGGQDLDVLYGETGNDTLYGGAGDDWLHYYVGHTVGNGGAGDGTDQYFGGAGNDNLVLTSARDNVYGGLVTSIELDQWEVLADAGNADGNAATDFVMNIYQTDGSTLQGQIFFTGGEFTTLWAQTGLINIGGDMVPLYGQFTWDGSDFG